MDEILFRSSQKIESLQVHLGLATNHLKEVIHNLSENSKTIALRTWNSSQTLHYREGVKDAWQIILNKSQELHYKFSYYVTVYSPKKLYLNLLSILSKPWTKRDVYFLCVGFACGGLIGIAVGLVIRKKEPILRYMQAVQCTQYSGTESACVIENAIAPHECGPDEVLVNVKAASVQVIDANICYGYGKTLRRILQRMYHKSRSDLPVTLGRDCTGIVTDIGTEVKRLEVGDEVWLTVPFWHQGTLSQSFLVSEKSVGRKPKNIGFEGACSLPYAGSLALTALQHAQICEENALGKRVFVHGGCSPVGCVLIQVLTYWGAEVTTSCSKRAVPVAKALGAADVIISDKNTPTDNKSALNIENSNDVSRVLPKELELREKFDAVIVTRECSLFEKDFLKYCKPDSQIFISTLPPEWSSDNYGMVVSFFYEGILHFKYFLEKLCNMSLNEFGEIHMCYVLLDEMREMVENGNLQTVVDKVYHTQDIELALAHIQSPESIGSTVISFR